MIVISTQGTFSSVIGGIRGRGLAFVGCVQPMYRFGRPPRYGGRSAGQTLIDSREGITCVLIGIGCPQ